MNSTKADADGVLLITGATGFVGGAVARLAERHGFSTILTPGRGWSGVPWTDVTHVVHCAAVIPAKVAEQGRTAADYATNVQLTADLLDRLEKSPVKSLAFLSSISVYDKSAASLDLDENAPKEREDSYALSKLRSEELIGAAAKRQGFAAWLLRASSVYGRGMNQDILLPALCRAAMAGGPMELRGPRGYTQNFVHVEDVAAIALTALTRGERGETVALNAFSDDSWELSALASMLAERLSPPGRQPMIVDNTTEPGAPRRTYPNRAVKQRLAVGFRRLSDCLQDVVA